MGREERMKQIFSVQPEADGALLRNFLRMCAVSTELARAVKFHGSGFFAAGEPILANRRVAAGQDISFELPEDGAGVAPQPEIPVKVVYEDAFAIVLEKIPAALAERVTKEISAPTIGIGAGGGCDGQVRLILDMLCFYIGFSPLFLRRYADLHTVMPGAVEQYVRDVKECDFPNEKEQY